MLANRLAKNAKRLKSWLKKTGISCYRLYDQDLPEYAVAIDVYGEAFHIQEYAPPASVDATKAQRRIREVRRVLEYSYPDSRDKLFFKERRRQSGDSQYQPLSAWNQKAEGFVVAEGRAKLEVNLKDYLDSGLFLDHRPVREMLAEMAAGKRFLNLFCYTAAATVQAALGGAQSSLSIDMSNTYLDWAKRNFELNRLNTSNHQLLRADCLEWLARREGQYDLIFLDPPTFSNSKKMSEILDIQRDHIALIDDAMAILAKGGTLVFSNNFRRFKMDPCLLEKYSIEDISAQSIPMDFQRNQKIHNCWRVRHPVK
jgi:23S rRNA (guanine2445-N2)-methyltransferase / 23S rRNA (guanine2069-N7)-methyltransferase